jgi:hypothetical protein
MFVSLEGAGLAQDQFFHANSILNSLQSITDATIPPNDDY